MSPELIVFVDKSGKPTGKTGPKLESHTNDTKLHLAFSCYIFNESSGELLVTRRALKKKVWPGVWTNSVCGHPLPKESLEAAIKRRVLYEVGIKNIQNISCILPSYTYTTPPYHGIVENEFCPVFIATTTDEVNANPDEVEDYKWLSWQEYKDFIENGNNVSYWAKDQYTQLVKSRKFIDFLKSNDL